MALPDKKTRDALDAADWDDIAPKLLRYVHHLMKEKTVRRLPDGMTAGDVVNIAVQKVYLGDRIWHPEKVPDLHYFLRKVLESDLSGHGLLDPRKFEHEPEYRDDEELLENLKDQADADAGSDETDEPFTKALYEEIKGDDELELIVAALELDFVRPADIAKETGLSVDTVYVARRRLERKARRAKQRMQEVAEGIE